MGDIDALTGSAREGGDTLPFHPHIFHPLRGCRELGLAEGLSAGHEEDDILGHETQHRRQIACPAGGEPGIDDGSNRAFILGH